MATIWVKPPVGLRVRDHRTKALWPVKTVKVEGEEVPVEPFETLPVEIPADDYVFAQMINHGDLVVCNEDGSPIPTPESDGSKSEKAPAPKVAAPAPKPAAAPDAAAQA